MVELSSFKYCRTPDGAGDRCETARYRVNEMEEELTNPNANTNARDANQHFIYPISFMATGNGETALHDLSRAWLADGGRQFA